MTFLPDLMGRNYTVATNGAMSIWYRVGIDYIHQLLEFCTMFTMVNIIVVDAHIGMNHLMEQNILQIRVWVAFIQGLGEKYDTTTTASIIITNT